jgi:hypothetical protein
MNWQFEKSMGCFLPTLSIALGALHAGEVLAIIDAPRVTAWKPLEPRTRAELPDLEDYGISLTVE